ncbi:hypothetical protein I3842_09G064500 [Carya illinoinensis]|uniref:Auxin response factor n=1 Tax=Carya illinoinensis TaxID=32201 RepID=A0A922E163_CARIL|nr:hypothetical protein I3842_09G064500 [Carya illinoinensis]KAG6694769.1 hypothetical protein I3842_09G064500 [Carya illinoinensis]KAG6694770.1 hypothetical protein I3842_09G064500 [Carya illinoinensis]KAG6694771.1 hypothetical protein I3842_09G064500 [Carya illinoinensis]
MGLIDLNTTEDDETPSSGSSASSWCSASALSASALASASASSVCLELWHACAGPLISLPKKNSVVVYFPQGHLEQVPDFPLAAYDLPPHVFCRVTDVKLHVEEGTDEVYAQVVLVPENEQFEHKLQEGEVDADGEEDDADVAAKSSTPHMFCKTLTASDTSTHGGFSVPRRAAEDCFPALDYKQQRPSQELVAKDLHGLEWRFRHIYRGQPRRHLLTTGWSGFVNKKKLLSGDAVLFLRGEDGELRLGIRRAAQVKGSGSFSVLCSRQMNHGSLMDVANAISTRSAFNIYYNPSRASSSEFIIPLRKFLKSLQHSISVGMRFKMRFEAEDAAERRYTGLVTGISEMDPVRWPGSKWRCLLVRWDDVETRHNRVSPWEIEPSSSLSGSASLMAPGSKRTRIGFPLGKLEFPIPTDGIGASDFGESLSFQKVLQGQEILGFTHDGIDTHSLRTSETRRCIPGSNGSVTAAIGDGVRNPVVNSDISYKGMGFGESLRFQKVLQGQEIFPSLPYERAPSTNEAHVNGGLGILDGVQVMSSRNGWPGMMQGNNTTMRPFSPPMQASSPSSVLMFQQATIPVSNLGSMYKFNSLEDQRISNRSLSVSEKIGGKLTSSSLYEHNFCRKDQGGTNSSSFEHNQLVSTLPPLATQSTFEGSQDLVPSCKSSCRLFGFSLTEENHVANTENSTPASSPLNPEASFLPRWGQVPSQASTDDRGSWNRLYQRNGLPKLDMYDYLIIGWSWI